MQNDNEWGNRKLICAYIVRSIYSHQLLSYYARRRGLHLTGSIETDPVPYMTMKSGQVLMSRRRSFVYLRFR